MKSVLSLAGIVLFSVLFVSPVKALPNPDAGSEYTSLNAIRAMMNDSQLFEQILPSKLIAFNLDSDQVRSISVIGKEGEGETSKFRLALEIQFDKTVDLLGLCTVEAVYAVDKFAANIFVLEGDVATTCQK